MSRVSVSRHRSCIPYSYPARCAGCPVVTAAARTSLTMSTLSGASILVTGATGSFGKAFIRYALDNLDPARLVIFSRDEYKQYEVRALFDDDRRLRWFIGDVRDRGRLTRATHRVDYVVHAAALKQVDTAEYNPFEYVQTNIIGSQHVVEAAIDAGVKKVCLLYTSPSPRDGLLYRMPSSA